MGELALYVARSLDLVRSRTNLVNRFAILRSSTNSQRWPSARQVFQIFQARLRRCQVVHVLRKRKKFDPGQSLSMVALLSILKILIGQSSMVRTILRQELGPTLSSHYLGLLMGRQNATPGRTTYPIAAKWSKLLLVASFVIS